MFHTPSKRKLLGGGGITPDYKSGKYENSKGVAALLRSNYYSQVSLAWYDKNGELVRKKFTTVEDFDKIFSFSPADEIFFRSFASGFGTPGQITGDDVLSRRIKAEIARYIWQQQGFYYVYMRSDETVIKAVSLMGEAASIANLVQK